MQPRRSRQRTAKEAARGRRRAEADLEAQMAGQAREQARQEAEALMKLKLPAVQTKKTEVLTKHIAARGEERSHRDGAGGEDAGCNGENQR